MIGCKKCGECCKWFAQAFNVSPDKDARRWIVYHGGEIKRNVVFLPIRCLHLDENNLCMIYDERPITCRNFPMGVQGCAPEKCRFFEDDNESQV